MNAPDAATGTPLRALTLGRALGWHAEGVAEDPPGSNWGPKVAYYLRVAGIHVRAAWCAAVVFAAALEAAILHQLDCPLLDVRRRALVNDYYALARERDWLIETERATRGDLVLYDFNGDGRWDHIGLLETPPEWRTGYRALEGNTTPETPRDGTPEEMSEREGFVLELKPREIAPGRVLFARWDEGIVYRGRGAVAAS